MRLSFENKNLRGVQGDTWMVVRGHCFCGERAVHGAGELDWQEARKGLLMLFLKESPTLPTAKLWVRVYFWFKSTHWASAVCLWKFVTERKRTKTAQRLLLTTPLRALILENEDFVGSLKSRRPGLEFPSYQLCDLGQVLPLLWAHVSLFIKMETVLPTS